MNSEKSPLVSIIVPFYNAHEHVRQTMESIFAQEYPNFEVIIVNDGSIAPTVETLLEGLDLSRLKVVNHETNKGLSAARNSAFEHSNGDFILPLDADDLITPDFLTLTVNELIESADIHAVYTQVRIFGDIEMDWIPDATMLNLMCGIPIQSTVLFKREVFDAVGGYSTVIKRSPDVDFWIRVLHQGFKLKRIEKPLYFYRKYAGSLSDTGKLTEVEDLAHANPQIYLSNLEAVFLLEDQKFTQLMAEICELKNGFNQLYDGYLALVERYDDVVRQLIKKKKSVQNTHVVYEKSDELLTFINQEFSGLLGKPEECDKESNKWLSKLSQIEKEYFKAKRAYSVIQSEFNKLEQRYLELHAIFDEAVSILQKLGVRYQISKLLGLSILEQAGHKGAIK